MRIVKQPKLLKQLEERLLQAVWRWQRGQSRHHDGATFKSGGAACFTQWFGSRLQLTPHLHLLMPEALWSDAGEVMQLPPPTDVDVEAVLLRTLRQVRKDWADWQEMWAEDEYEALQQRVIQEAFAFDAPVRRKKQKRVAVAEGFSLHADTAGHANDRQGLERLCRYGSRGPIAECRLRKLDDGCIEYTPKRGKPFTLTATALVKRLVALVPPARQHLTSFHGVLGPNANLRSIVTNRAETSMETAKPSPAKKNKRPRLDWAKLHQHTFKNDVLKCHCGGRRTARALYSTHRAAEERLTELGALLPPPRVLPPATAPPQLALAL